MICDGGDDDDDDNHNNNNNTCACVGYPDGTFHNYVSGSVPIVMYITVTVYVVQRSTTGQYAI